MKKQAANDFGQTLEEKLKTHYWKELISRRLFMTMKRTVSNATTGQAGVTPDSQTLPKD